MGGAKHFFERDRRKHKGIFVSLEKGVFFVGVGGGLGEEEKCVRGRKDPISSCVVL